MKLLRVCILIAAVSSANSEHSYSDDPPECQRSVPICLDAKKVAAAVAVGVASGVVAGPLMVAGAGWLGFGAGGIVANGIGANMMAGGHLPGLVALLQSIGALGMAPIGAQILVGVSTSTLFLLFSPCTCASLDAGTDVFVSNGTALCKVTCSGPFTSIYMIRAESAAVLL